MWIQYITYTITKLQKPVTVVTASVTVLSKNPLANMKEWPAVGKARLSPYYCCCPTSWSKALLITLPLWLNHNHVSLSLYFSFNFQPQYGLLSYWEILCPLNPLTSITSLKPSSAFSVLLGLWWVVLPFAGVPEEQRDANGRQSHHTERSPVQLENGDQGKWARFQGTVQKRKTFFVLFEC